MYGGEGDDYLVGGAGADLIDGGNGYDLASYETSTAGVTINTATGTVAGGEAAGDTIVNIEAFAGSNYADSFIGGNSNDDFYGLGGNDSFDGGAGENWLEGGSGNDIYYFRQDFGFDHVIEYEGAGTDTVYVEGFDESQITFGSSGNDLYMMSSTQMDVMRFQDWFVNFAVEQFAFASSGSVYTAENIASMFGVSIPSTQTETA